MNNLSVLSLSTFKVGAAHEVEMRERLPLPFWLPLLIRMEGCDCPL